MYLFENKRIICLCLMGFLLVNCGNVQKNQVDAQVSRLSSGDANDTSINPGETKEINLGDITFIIPKWTFSEKVQLNYIDPTTYSENNSIPSYLSGVGYAILDPENPNQEVLAKKSFQVCLRFKSDEDLSKIKGQIFGIKISGALDSASEEIPNQDLDIFKNNSQNKHQACYNTSKTSALILILLKLQDQNIGTGNDDGNQKKSVNQQPNEIIVTTGSTKNGGAALNETDAQGDALLNSFPGKTIVDDNSTLALKFPVKTILKQRYFQPSESLSLSLESTDISLQNSPENTVTVKNLSTDQLIADHVKFDINVENVFYIHPDNTQNKFKYGSNILEIYISTSSDLVLKTKYEIFISNIEYFSMNANLDLKKTSEGLSIATWVSQFDNDAVTSSEGYKLETGYGAIVK